MKTRKIFKTLKNHWEKMGIHVNKYSSKIMCISVKVGIRTYMTYANCKTLTSFYGFLGLTQTK